MSLYHVQDGDRPMFVIADDYGKAVEKWRDLVAKENDMEPHDVEDPLGVQFICDDNDLIL